MFVDSEPIIQKSTKRIAQELHNNFFLPRKKLFEA
jgi:hypothetical protein